MYGCHRHHSVVTGFLARDVWHVSAQRCAGMVLVMERGGGHPLPSLTFEGVSFMCAFIEYTKQEAQHVYYLCMGYVGEGKNRWILNPHKNFPCPIPNTHILNLFLMPPCVPTVGKNYIQ